MAEKPSVIAIRALYLEDRVRVLQREYRALRTAARTVVFGLVLQERWEDDCSLLVRAQVVGEYSAAAGGVSVGDVRRLREALELRREER